MKTHKRRSGDFSRQVKIIKGGYKGHYTWHIQDWLGSTLESGWERTSQKRNEAASAASTRQRERIQADSEAHLKHYRERYAPKTQYGRNRVAINVNCEASLA